MRWRTNDPPSSTMRCRIAHNYVNNVYRDTTYYYSWSDKTGATVFVLNGKHSAEHELPPPSDKYHFALAAEEAWSHYLLADILTSLQHGASYTFRLRGRDGICFHKDYLELTLNNKVQRFYPGDLTDIRVKEGTIALKEPGAKEGWFTSTGIHSFSFDELANARLFLMLVEQTYGIPTNA
jgi:hypothetical protein